MENWKDVKQNNPPNERIIVKDDLGNEGFAEPTYYPWKMVDNKIVWLDEEYWDGGFLCECSGIESIIKGNITHWMPLPKPPVK